MLQPPPPPNDEDYQFDDIYMEDEEEDHMAAPQDHNEHIPQCLDMIHLVFHNYTQIHLFLVINGAYSH